YAACGNAQSRNGDRADLRFLGWCRRADNLRGHAFGVECDLCGDGQAGAQPAAEEREVRVRTMCHFSAYAGVTLKIQRASGDLRLSVLFNRSLPFKGRARVGIG